MSEQLRERVYQAVSDAIGDNAPSRTAITNAVMAVLGEAASAPADLRAAFVAGAKWCEEMAVGFCENDEVAIIEATMRYPDAAGEQADETVLALVRVCNDCFLSYETPRVRVISGRKIASCPRRVALRAGITDDSERMVTDESHGTGQPNG